MLPPEVGLPVSRLTGTAVCRILPVLSCRGGELGLPTAWLAQANKRKEKGGKEKWRPSWNTLYKVETQLELRETNVGAANRKVSANKRREADFLSEEVFAAKFSVFLNADVLVMKFINNQKVLEKEKQQDYNAP